ncbi:hypothetical protein CCACVL1_01079, partial [Corchorus capsularis]
DDVESEMKDSEIKQTMDLYNVIRKEALSTKQK